MSTSRQHAKTTITFCWIERMRCRISVLYLEIQQTFINNIFKFFFFFGIAAS